MDDLKKLIESLGVDNTDDVIKALQEQIDSKLDEVKKEYDVNLAKKLAAIQEANEKKVEEKLQSEKELMVEWHNAVINKELSEVDNQLKIAKEIRNVRAGMEKVMEGLKEVGIDTTQMFENVAAKEVLSLQEEIEELKCKLAQQEAYTTAFNRSYIVSEATRGMSDVGRDAIISQADAIDESYDIERFASLVEMMIMDKNLKENTQQETKAEKEVNEDKTSSRINESFVGKTPDRVDDVTFFFKKH